ncbi:hypothetical protein BGX28_001002 [Mortierella sp. GBA30]|nr:hypothetical protein BGX28_001002 [Mortierella sp. GBA30]
MTDALLLNCLADGEKTTFPVEIESTKTIGQLKKKIKEEKTPEFDDIAADRLTLWRVSIPIINGDKSSILLRNIVVDDKEELGPATRLSKVFTNKPPEETIHIIVQRPDAVAKRDREEVAGPSSEGKRRRPDDDLLDAIKEAGLTEKAVANGRPGLSRLNNKERVSLLDFIGRVVRDTDAFYALLSTSLELKGANLEDIDKLSAPRDALLPVVNTEDLYVRQAYKDLYDEVSWKFQDSPRNRTRKHVVLTGTSGIGKSAFLVYFTVRLLATGSDDNPSIVVFQEKGGSKCYAYGGLSTVRYGDIEDFRPFLDLPETWYLVDSSPNPRLENARTIISASPKTLFSELNQYQEVDKRVPWRYYMAPWTLEELKQCRCSVEGFHVVPEDIVEELYGMIGGVPRYVLEKPKDVLNLDPSDTADAKKSACARVLQAIDVVRDPLRMMQCFEQGKESLEHSSRLLHRWPTHDHKDFHLEWASAYIADKIGESLKEVAWQQILDKLVGVNVGTAKGPMFELYVRHIFRKGGYDFPNQESST